LVLAKGSFLLVTPVFAVMLLGLVFLGSPPGAARVRIVAASGLVAAGYLTANAPLAVERLMLDQGLVPSNRGGLVLAVRAGYQDLEPADWRAVYAQGGPVAVERWGIDPEGLRTKGRAGSRTFWKSGSDFFASDRQAYAAGRVDLAHSFYARGVATCSSLESGHSEQLESCATWAVKQFRDRPAEYLLLTAAAYWTEFWFVVDGSWFDVFVNLVLMAALHFVALQALLRREAVWFALSALPIGLLAFHALVTAPVNEPRHTLMTIGVATVAASLVISRERRA
jgi:hypothetical protein